mmetsp:Transcript_17074/g.15030  ORF Transcript_17074/g.15030 Transcript_17074/m.15030 type:complete len:100 (-) Transcript_17074:16-315(-)
MPEYVLFLFKRFDFINRRKISKRISYPDKILLNDQFDPDGIKYQLNGIVIHSGHLSGGHYTAIGRKKKDWILFNDDRVRKTKSNIALEKDAYLLFYKRI